MYVRAKFMLYFLPYVVNQKAYMSRMYLCGILMTIKKNTTLACPLGSMYVQVSREVTLWVLVNDLLIGMPRISTLCSVYSKRAKFGTHASDEISTRAGVPQHGGKPPE